ncbi:hypothetical protein JTE90_016757 [Oedothorax gibbosus]|uniref:J domain-containing protein n=1 Tax=Oedothorax gibbosus TaxID=931172 RepID=A0AAV6W064_9ARAC|nr:hypothetical protein JTE90_016757 [Oedothorax gibbosus]
MDGVYSLIDGLYCGQQECYSVLGVERTASKNEIAKAYRLLAKKHHPDKHRTLEEKKKASEIFTLIATAYEVLKDDESRKDYDYMLDNPDKVYGHYYRYYRRHMAPKVDVRIVIVVTISVISLVQYFAACSRYKSAIKYLVTVPKYRLKAMEIAKEENLFATSKKKDRRTKEEIKEEYENVLKKIIENKMDIRGGYSKPSLLDILWMQIICSPYTLISYVAWYIRWMWKFNIQKQEYGEEEKIYLIQKNLQCSSVQWEAFPDNEKDTCFKHKLWMKENYKVWKKEKEMDLKAQNADSGRYKMTRRYLKNQGQRPISFDD